MTRKIELTLEAKYQLLLQIANQTSDTLDLEIILNQLLDQLFYIVQYDAAGIFVLNRDLVHPRHAQPRGLIAGIARRGFDSHSPDTDPMLRLGKGIIGYVIASGKSLVLPDVRLDKRYVIGRRQTLSEITVPILWNERPIGALNLESDQVGAFDAGDLESLQFFAAVAALSIEKAMLHRQLLDKDHLEDQLRTAREVQARLLPQTPPVIPGYELAGVSLPTYEIGGDYYDYLPLDQHRFGFVVADVAGDGVPAALVMSAFRALLRTNARREPDPASLAGTLNRLLPEFSGSGDFVTAFYGVLEPATGRLLYANCGHNPPLLIHINGHAERLEPKGPALGIFSTGQFELGEALLAEGDLLVLYTDGVVELINPDGEFFGLSRLEQAVCASCQDPAQTTLQDIIATTQAFSGSNLYRDDFTLVILRRISMQAGS